VLDEGTPAPRAWRADLSPLPIHQWPDLSGDAALFAATRDLIELGFVLIHATPTDPKAILDIARRFGFVRETNFGSYFEVYSRPNSTDLAYRPVALGPPYRQPLPHAGARACSCCTACRTRPRAACPRWSTAWPWPSSCSRRTRKVSRC
jgi:hypothetical protein